MAAAGKSREHASAGTAQFMPRVAEGTDFASKSIDIML